MSDLELTININSLIEEIETLSEISDTASPAVTRILYTETDLKGREYIMGLAREAGLQIREDAIGNIFMNWRGSDPALKPVATGSHTDAIPYSGKYDGVVGVLGAIEAIRALKRTGFTPLHSIEVIMFTAEEPTRFGIGCLGSRTLSGNLVADQLELLKDADGVPFNTVRKEAGYIGSLEGVPVAVGSYQAFIELHIEQGPRLEDWGIDIGLVTAIAAPASIRVTVEGEGGHAGSVLMQERGDALIPAAQIAIEVQQIAKMSPSEFSVATTGGFKVFPGAVNSIPSKVILEIDIRDVQLTTRDSMVDAINAAINKICEAHKVRCSTELINRDAPIECDQQLIQITAQICQDSDVSCRQMISHAYHDTLFMAGICPVSMIFVPSKKGYSHRPEEYTSAIHIEKGVEILARTLAKLAI